MAKSLYSLRRVNPRFPVSADAEIMLKDGRWIHGQLSELSLRGCYVDSLEPLPVGTELHLSVFDGIGTCELPGKVIYKHSGGGLGVAGMGVLFSEMPADQNSVIHAWIDELSGRGARNMGSDIPAPRPS
ncbi:MAG TPA: PilZ domain-containing protein [Candidatus Aquilonibacter sp.]|nr:PilZ domain-containing protein [Candidatus Aquilonibacter sp.]